MRRGAELGDFTTGWRVLPISAAALAIGVLGAFVARALLGLSGGRPSAASWSGSAAGSFPRRSASATT